MDRGRMPVTAPAPALEYDYGEYAEPESPEPTMTWQRRVGGCLVIAVAFLGAVTLGLFLAAGLASISLGDLWQHFVDWLADRGISF